jgi:hypothetical protein
MVVGDMTRKLSGRTVSQSPRRARTILGPDGTPGAGLGGGYKKRPARTLLNIWTSQHVFQHL